MSFSSDTSPFSRPHRLPNLLASLLVVVLLAGAGCSLLRLKRTQGSEVVTPSGLRYTDLKVGDGPSPRLGQTVTVNYVGWLDNDRQFDSSSQHGGPARFVLGPALIAGWNEALQTMKVGGKRRMIIPPNLAYGARGTSNVPPNATLTFEVELLSVK